jgi:hypothetical protein
MKMIDIKTKQRDVFMIRESIFESIVKDIFSLGMISVLLYVNNKYCGGLWVFNWLCFFIYALYLTKMVRKDKIVTIKEAIAYLQTLDTTTSEADK